MNEIIACHGGSLMDSHSHPSQRVRMNVTEQVTAVDLHAHLRVRRKEKEFGIKVLK